MSLSGGRRMALLAGLAALAVAWLGPLPRLASGIFSAHMAMHVLVVSVAAPLISLGLAGSRLDPAVRWPLLFLPIPASVVDLAVIWAWHAPGAHLLSQHDARWMALEQASFLAVGLAVWLSAFGGARERQRARIPGGVFGLLMTSMHMTLLGVLLAVSARPLYAHGMCSTVGLTPHEDQQLGGVLMLAAGGSSYLIGGLLLLGRLLTPTPRQAEGLP